MTTRIHAVTFDFWNTLYSADSGSMDEVWPLRFSVLHDLLNDAGVQVTNGDLERARESSFHAYMAAWHGGSHFGAPEHVRHVLAFFGAAAPEDAVAEASVKIEQSTLCVRLKPLPGVLEAIPALASAGYRLGVISDTSLTPGRLLQTYLKDDGLLEYFSALTFSDETGFPKPDVRMFGRTLAALGVAPAEAAHVGDMPRTDIAGAKALGVLAIRYTGAMDVDEPPAADFVIGDHRELPGLLTRLEDQPGEA